MILLETSQGFISHRFIVRFQRTGSVWTVFYQAGEDLESAEASVDDVEEFMATIKRL